MPLSAAASIKCRGFPQWESLLAELQAIRKQMEGLLKLRLLDEIESSTFAEKQTELRTRETRLLTRLEGCGRQQSERGELAVKVLNFRKLSRRSGLTILNSMVRNNRPWRTP